MITPLLLVFGFDSLLKVVDQEWIELSIILFALLIGSISFIDGFLKHRQHFISVLFIAGFLLLINGESVADAWRSVGLSVGGAAVIAYAHFQNLKWKRHAVAA